MPAKRTIQVLEHDNRSGLTYLQEENRLREIFRDTYVDSHDNISYMRGKDCFLRKVIDDAYRWNRKI
jgi:hypothetical protein